MSIEGPEASTVKIYLFKEDTVKAFREKKFPKPVIDALKILWETHLERAYKKKGKTKQRQLFITKAALERFLRRELANKERAEISEIEKNIESRSALVQKIPLASDYTFFLKRSEHTDQILKSLLTSNDRRKSSRPTTHYESELWLWDNIDQRAAVGRALVCSCFKGTRWSITFRSQKEYPKIERGELFYSDLSDITDTLYRTIFKAQESDMHGLIVIAGRTGSGKSQIAHGLIESYLRTHENSIATVRMPHLLTHEDPVEKVFLRENIGGADYTQRENGIDTRNLQETLDNALRQTPKIMFRGETRRPKEWERILRFAGTGHLALTTSHAGSLVEAMGNILQETNSTTPAARSKVADRLLAVIHIKSETDAATGTSFLIPAIWHRTPNGMKALMSEGLSSLLPNTPPRLKVVEQKKLHLPGSISRYWFARELTARAANRDPGLENKIKKKAMEWDLEGI